MSTDAKTTKDLVQTLEDGRDGFTKAADKLADTDQSELAPRFRQFAEQRGSMVTELETLAAQYGDDIDEDGSVAAAVHRGWLSLKDALSGSSAKGVLDAAEQGEDHAVKEYEKALEKDISTGLASTVRRQLTDIRSTHDEVKRLRDSVK